MAKIKGWERTGWDVKPRFQNIYGKNGSDRVVWIDNWDRGQWAVVFGIEQPSKEMAVRYKEEGNYTNVANKKDAVEAQRQYMEEN